MANGVTRDEFDQLARRVTALERSLAAIAELITSQIIPYLETIDTKLDAIDARFDALEAKVDGYAAQVNEAMQSFDAQASRHERFTTAIAAHFGIDLDG